MTDKQHIDDSVLNEAAGGTYEKVRESLLTEISDELREKLTLAVTDKQACKILADSGINVEDLERRVEELGIPVKQLSLSEDLLDKVVGGFQDSDYNFDVRCVCGNANRDEFSRQFWSSLFNSKAKSIYRCKKCGQYLVIRDSRTTEYFPAELYDEQFSWL